MTLEGKTAVVTGASRGIGRAIALALAREGVVVAVGARSEENLKRVVSEIDSDGGRGFAVALDVTDSRSIADAAEQIGSALGPVDIVVNNAGIAKSAKTVDMDEEFWEEHLKVNLTGAFLVTREFLPGLIKRSRGRIVNVASTAGKVGFLYTAAYCASKHGLLGFTRALALEMAPYNVTVNAVCPGFVRTEMTARSVTNISKKTGMQEKDAMAKLEAFSPQNRLVEPEEVARIAVMLAGDEARSINGQAINIDGGAVFY